MKNNNIPDVSCTHQGETIEQKTTRLGLLADGSAPCKSQIKRLVRQRAGTRNFFLECKMVELAIAEEREACKWVSVKDSRPTQNALLAVQLPNGKYVVRRGSYVNKFEEESYDEDHVDYNEADDTSYIPEGWYESIANWDDYSSVLINEGAVTHWQPMPDVKKLKPVEVKE